MFTLRNRRPATPFAAFTSNDLIEVAAALSSSLFPMHLSAWREALKARTEGKGAVPDSYLVAMHKVLVEETSERSLDFEDAIAASIAMHELGSRYAQSTAMLLLSELHAVGSELAGVLEAALALHTPLGPAGKSSRPSHGVQLLRAVRLSTTRADVRAQATVLLADAYRMGLGVELDPDAALHLYAAALEEGGTRTARAHFHIGTWLLRAASRSPVPRKSLARAEQHFMQGTGAGCMRSTSALGLLHAQGRAARPDSDFGRDLLEIAASAGTAPPAGLRSEHFPGPGPHERERPCAPPYRPPRDPSAFIAGMRGLLRGAFRLPRGTPTNHLMETLLATRPQS